MAKKTNPTAAPVTKPVPPPPTPPVANVMVQPSPFNLDTNAAPDYTVDIYVRGRLMGYVIRNAAGNAVGSSIPLFSNRSIQLLARMLAGGIWRSRSLFRHHGTGL